MKDNKRIYLPCDCGSEVLSLQYDVDFDDVELSIYELQRQTAWKYKLRSIWRILRHGSPYGDQLIVSHTAFLAFLDQARELIERKEN